MVQRSSTDLKGLRPANYRGFSGDKAIELRYKELYDGSPALCRTINTDGIILDCNYSYAEHLGYSKEELIGRSIFETTAEQSLNAMRESFEAWKKTGVVLDREVWLKRKDGTVFPCLISATNLYDENGALIGSNTVIKDISEIYKVRKELEKANEELTRRVNDALLFEQMIKSQHTRLRQLAKELEKANEELKLKDRLKDEFICVAAHELRTPIQPILGYAELATRKVITEEQAWNGVIQHARRLQSLANDILDVSRIESGNLKYLMAKVSINSMIELVVNNANVNLPSNIIIFTDLDQDVEIEADRERIIQALTNIIDNAIKFTKEGSITVKSRVFPDENRVEISLRDTGCGIPEEILPNIFNKFVTKGNIDARVQGSGLGLFICKAIVVAHGGEIFASNNPHGGATFTIVLPLSRK
ncbi:MAG: PAS domain-containing sensor histidine kinase [Nitrososphaerales archaeon]